MAKDRAESVTRRGRKRRKSFSTLNLKSSERRRIFQFNWKAISYRNLSGKVSVCVKLFSRRRLTQIV